jgi:hypothetical protein
MRRLPCVIMLLISVPFSKASAVARESVAAQASRVQTLLTAIQKDPGARVELTQNLRQTIVTSQKQLAREQLTAVLKPGRLPLPDPSLLLVQGHRFVLPKLAGQRRCEAIQKDWRDLDLVYQEVSELALELEEVYSTPQFCAPCADTVLTTLKEATAELESISTRLNEDGDRQIMAVWDPEDFTRNGQGPYATLSWDKLVYYNIDGDSRVGDAAHPLPPLPGFSLRSPLLQNGIQFQTEATAERACSPGFEIRLDAIARATLPLDEIELPRDQIRIRMRPIQVNLRLQAL